MDLEQFVSGVLSSLMRGVQQAATAAAEIGGAVNPSQFGGRPVGDFQKVHFDVALTAETAGTQEGGAKISVAGFGGLGGTLENSTRNSQVSRVQFDVVVSLPTQPRKQRGAFVESPPPTLERCREHNAGELSRRSRGALRDSLHALARRPISAARHSFRPIVA
jgi:hypothetical protein